MTTIEDQVRDAAPTPRSSPDVEAIWRRGSRQRRVDRALLGTAGVAFVALIAVAANVLTAGPGTDGPIIAEPPVSTPTGPPSFDAAPPAVAPADPLPAGWQRIEVGDARFGLPPDVAVVEQRPGDEARCTNAIDEDTAFVAPDGLPAAQAAGDVVCRLGRPASVAVTAVRLSTVGRLDPPIDATPLRVNGVVGSTVPPVPAGVDTRTYRFPSLDLQLTFAFLDNRPDLDEQVLATLAHADDSRPIVADVPITATVVQQPDPFTIEFGQVYAAADGTWVHGLTITNTGAEPLELSGPTIAARMTNDDGGLLFATDPDCLADPGPPESQGCDSIARAELLGPGESLARTITITGPTAGLPAGTYTGDVRLRFRGSAGADGAGSTDDTVDARESTAGLRYEVGQDLSVAPPSPTTRLDVEVEEDIEPFDVAVTDPTATVDGWTYEVSITNVGDRAYLISDERWADRLVNGDDLLLVGGHGCSFDEVDGDREVFCTDELRIPELAPGESFTDTVIVAGEVAPPGVRFRLVEELTWWNIPVVDDGQALEAPPAGSGEVVLVHTVGSPDLQVLQGDPGQEVPPKCAPPYVPIEVMPLEVIIPDEFRVRVVVGDEVRVDQVAIVYRSEDGTEVRRQVAAGDLPSGSHDVSVPLDLQDGDGAPLEPGRAYLRRAEIDFTRVAATGIEPCAGGDGQLGTSIDTFVFQE